MSGLLRFGLLATLGLGLWLSLALEAGQVQKPIRQGGYRLPSWKNVLQQRLEAFGHRNWIVIADSAYPSQSRPGIETVVTGADQLEVVKYVLDELRRCQHVRPTVYLDAELPHVSDRDAPGIDKYRAALKLVLFNRKIESLPHEKIIDKLDRAGARFNVLILKTNLTLPYTSVFLELDCAYWDAAREKRLREAMEKVKQKP